MTRTRVRTARRRHGERGAATAFVVGMAVVLLACAGLVIDGGTALNARMRLADDVEQAARAGAQEIDEGALRDSGVVVLDQAAAESRARGFVVGRGYTSGTVNADGDSMFVAASDRVETRMLGLIGIRSFTISASATAGAISQ